MIILARWYDLALLPERHVENWRNLKRMETSNRVIVRDSEEGVGSLCLFVKSKLLEEGAKRDPRPHFGS